MACDESELAFLQRLRLTLVATRRSTAAVAEYSRACQMPELAKTSEDQLVRISQQIADIERRIKEMP